MKSKEDESGMIVNTKYGMLEGREAGGLCTFLGIPYAQPPVGRRRFKPPVPPEPWEGVRKAWNYQARCPQPYMTKYPGHFMVGRYFDGPPDSEDCLYLNVWTPGLDGAKRPVVVMIHGGGHIIGSARSDNTDGQHFCGDHNTVFVTLNHRLGAFGFLYLGELLGKEYETSGSVGFMDQIAALKWVQENIASFGGDPDNVTIMGQSGGGEAVIQIICSPTGKGLFKRAIVESPSQSYQDKKTAALITRRMLNRYGLKPEEASKLLDMPARQLMENFGAGVMVGPVLDEVNFPQAPEEYLAAGNAKGVDLLIGYNRFERGVCPAAPVPVETRIAAIENRFGLHAPHIIERYKNYLRTMPEYEAWSTIDTEFTFGANTRGFTYLMATNGARVWVYRWDLFDNAPPTHCAELKYVYRWPAEEAPAGYPKEYQFMADLINNSWHAFAATGDPRVDGMPEWTPYTDATSGKRMYFSQFPSAEPYDLHDYDPEFMMQELIL